MKNKTGTNSPALPGMIIHRQEKTLKNTAQLLRVMLRLEVTHPHKQSLKEELILKQVVFLYPVRQDGLRCRSHEVETIYTIFRQG